MGGAGCSQHRVSVQFVLRVAKKVVNRRWFSNVFHISSYYIHVVLGSLGNLVSLESPARAPSMKIVPGIHNREY